MFDKGKRESKKTDKNWGKSQQKIICQKSQEEWKNESEWEGEREREV